MPIFLHNIPMNKSLIIGILLNCIVLLVGYLFIDNRIDKLEDSSQQSDQSIVQSFQNWIDSVTQPATNPPNEKVVQE